MTSEQWGEITFEGTSFLKFNFPTRVGFIQVNHVFGINTCSCDKCVRKVIIEKNNGNWYLLENSFTMRPLIFAEIRRSILKDIS